MRPSRPTPTISAMSTTTATATITMPTIAMAWFLDSVPIKDSFETSVNLLDFFLEWNKSNYFISVF